MLEMPRVTINIAYQSYSFENKGTSTLEEFKNLIDRIE